MSLNGQGMSEQDANHPKVGQAKQVFNDEMIELGACVYCISRYHPNEIYKRSRSELENMFSSKTITTICPVCLGLLPFPADLSMVYEKVKFQEYDVKSFAVQLSLPANLCIRERLVHERVNQNPIYSIKEVLKYWTELSIKENIKLDCLPNGELKIFIEIESVSMEEDCLKFEQKVKIKDRKARKALVSRNQVEQLVSKMEQHEFLSKFAFNIPASMPIVQKVEEARDFVYLAGRYMKYRRDITQSPWFIKGERHGKYSVSEFIEDGIKKETCAIDCKFMSAGREDMDVLMLNSGRPFLVQLANCKRFYGVDCKLIESEINNSTKDVQVSQLHWVSHEAANYIKEGEEFKRKVYSCLVYVKEGITVNQLDALATTYEIDQKTPVRVMHRRSNLTRKKAVEILKTELINNHYFTLELSTQAGTYIKEFVHGDFGRTSPSITCILGVQADLLELDVLNIEMEWPLESFIIR